MMAKLPVAGAVKKRLALEIGAARAAAVNRTIITNVLGRVAGDARWRTYLAVAPDTAIVSRVLPRHVPRIPQGRGDLGLRMQRIFDRKWIGPVIVIGSDIPGITANDIARAFHALKSHDAVLGPAGDGGYWLVGFRRVLKAPQAFRNVRWSGPNALADTLANLAELKVAFATTKSDVDDAASLETSSSRLGRRILRI